MLSLLALHLVIALWVSRLVNVTIDDFYGDARTSVRPQYVPTARATSRSYANLNLYNGSCTTMFNAYEKSPSIVTLTFNGTMIYVHTLLRGGLGAVLYFYLDGSRHPDGQYIGTSDSEASDFSVLYSQLVFQSQELEQAPHTLQIQSSPDDPDFCFDYAEYTVDEADLHPHSATTSTSSASITTAESCAFPTLSTGQRVSSESKRMVLAAAMAGAAAALLSTCAWFWITKRKRRRCRKARSLEIPTALADVGESMLSQAESLRSQVGKVVGSEEEVPSPVAHARPASASLGVDAKTQPRSNGITPFMGQPDPELVCSAEKDLKTRWEKTSHTPPISQALLLEDKHGDTGRDERHAPDTVSKPTDEAAAIRAELERLCAENERARAESERVRAAFERAQAEIEMLTEAASPPPYSYAGRGRLTLS